MIKKALIIAVLLSLVGVLGCTSSSTTTKTPASVKPIREAQIATTWAMEQVEINLQSEVAIILNLANGDKVDGYYYVESGDSVSFSISGNSMIYQTSVTTQGATSDRFSFTASTAQGIAYTLKFTPMATSQGRGEATIFLEIIYPATGQIFVPFGTK